jgi:HEAT repeat protein
VFGSAENHPLERAFVELTILEHRTRPGAQLRYWNLADSNPRERAVLGRRYQVDQSEHDEWSERQKRTMNADRLLLRHAKAVVAGAPGAGKSTLLRYLASQALMRANRFPIFLELKEVSGEDLQQAKGDLSQLLSDKICPPLARNAAELEALQAYIRSRFGAGEATVILDGLDEVSEGSGFNELCRAIQRFSTTGDTNELIVSARPYALHARLDLREVEILPLRPRQVEHFIEHIYGRTAKAQSFAAQLSRPDLRDLASVPLLLGMLTYLHMEGDVPSGDRLELFRRIVYHLTNTLDQEKAIERFHLPDPDGALKRDFLSQLACDQLCLEPGDHNRDVLTGEVILRAAKAFCVTERLPLEQARWLAKDTKATPLLREIYPDAWVFVHPTLQEYQAAVGLARRNDRLQVFCRSYFHPLLAETEFLPMTLGLLEEDSEAVFSLLEQLPESLTLTSLRLRLRSSRYGVQIDPAEWQRLADRLAEFVHRQQSYYLRMVLDACTGLRRVHLDTLTAHIVPCLDSPIQGVRRDAVTALGWFGRPQSAIALCESMRGATGDLVWTINEALARIGSDSALQCALKALEESDNTQRHAAAITIGLIGDEQAVPHLVKRLSDNDFLVRWATVNALGQIGGTEAINALVEALKDEHANVRESAAAYLASRGPDDVEQQLLALLDTANTSVSPKTRVAVLEALGKNVSDRLFDAVRKLQDSNDRNFRFPVIRALGSIGGDRAIERLVAALQNPVEQVAIFAAQELGQLGGRKALDALIAIVNQGGVFERQRACAAAAEALGSIGGEEPLATLSNALQSQVSEVRAGALKGLVRRGGEAAVAGLIRALNDDDMVVRWYAVDASPQFGGRKIVASLLDALKSDDNSFVRWNVAKALGRIGHNDAHDGLMDASQNDSDPYVRGWALAAMDQLEGRPARAKLLMASSGEMSFESVRANVFELLAQQAGEKIVAFLLESSVSSAQEADAAREMLTKLDHSTLSSGLLMALQDERLGARTRAAELIGYYRRDEAVVEELSRLAEEDPVSEVKEAARTALQRVYFVRETIAKAG